MGRERLSLLSLWSPSLGRDKTSLVSWLLCFLGFWVEFLSQGFYYLCYTILYHSIDSYLIPLTGNGVWKRRCEGFLALPIP